MTRISKEPDVRKAELVDAAEKLFIEQGYDETAVSDIVRAAKVAQGTFYYYFGSKDDIRDAVIDKNIEEVRELTQKVLDTPGLNALERMTAYSAAFGGWVKTHEKISAYIHEKKNEVLHFRMSSRVMEFMIPAYQRIIEQGVGEGVFHTDYPLEAAKALMGISENVMDGDHPTSESLKDPQMKRKVMAMLVFTERLLGAKPGLFSAMAKDHGVEL